MNEALMYAHADAVDAIDGWLRVSRMGGHLPASARTFVDDFNAGRNIERWSRADIERVMPFRSEAPRLLMVIRAGALFTPILLTWLALSQVIGPFALYLQNQQPSANFLWFWQTNPGGAFAEVWSLGHVALTDAAILAFLTVLAMRITWWETTRAERTEHAYEAMLSAVETYFSTVRS